MAAAVRAREDTHPPIIGKAGNYTVFITPPATPRPPEVPGSPKTPVSVDGNPKSKLSPPLPPKTPPLTALPSMRVSPLESVKLSGAAQAKSPPSTPPPVQVPPLQFERSKEKGSSRSAFTFFWDAVAKVQDAHSSLDECLAHWLGLNQSKYQWALNDYYESKGMDKSGKPEELGSKGSV